MEQLPEDFLTEPREDITVQRIDFAECGLPDYKDDYAVVIDNALSVEECDKLLQAAEATSDGKWERALLNIGGGRQIMVEEQRNCGRIIWDHRDMVARIWKRIEHVVPEIARLEDRPHITGPGPVKRGEVWNMTRLNERMRFLKYEGGEYFKAHCDGAYETPDQEERSYFTLHLYLNTASSWTGSVLSSLSPLKSKKEPKDQLVGGSTPFFNRSMKQRFDVKPKAGRVLIFQHRNLLHSGDDVLKGVKYTLRTDIMFHREAFDL